MNSSVNTTNTDYHEEKDIGVVILFLSFSVLAACLCKTVLSKILKNKIPVPFTVAVLILSFVIGLIVTHMKTIDNNFQRGEIELSEIHPHLIYYIFLPLLIFDSSFNGHFHLVKRQLLSAILLAGPGVLMSTGIIALFSISIFPYNWSLLIGLLFGSILSATDPVAVVALLHDSGASKSLASLIDSESLLNDGSAFVIFLIFKKIVVGEAYTAKSIIINIIKFSIGKLLNNLFILSPIFIFLGGPAFGLACGYICVMILNRINNELEVEIAFTFAIAYLVFFVADVELGVSAVLALVTMGLYMAKHKYCISSNVQLPMASAWRIATYLINIMIFTVTGIILAKSLVGASTNIIAQDFGFSIILYVVIHIGRALTIAILYPLIRQTGVRISWKDCLILMWSGLRGSMALILVLIVDLDSRIDSVTRNHFLFHVSMIALFTLIINGTSSKYLVKFLGLKQGTKESQIVLSQALEHMQRHTFSQLLNMKQDEQFAEVDWKMLGEFLPEKLLKELDEERGTTIDQQLIASSEPSGTSTTHPFVTTSNNHLSSAQNDAIVSLTNIDDKRRQNIRNVLVIRFLTAMSIDYERQWHLGMIRRRTLDILIKSVEQAKQKCSFELHWQLLVGHFRLSFLLLNLIRFNYFDFINKWTNNFLFNHIFLTIELTLGE
jgi:NhaP-type Na+/H+ or K+/H+ antiporter